MWQYNGSLGDYNTRAQAAWLTKKRRVRLHQLVKRMLPVAGTATVHRHTTNRVTRPFKLNNSNALLLQRFDTGPFLRSGPSPAHRMDAISLRINIRIHTDSWTLRDGHAKKWDERRSAGD
jgi:hypothetical protein